LEISFCVHNTCYWLLCCAGWTNSTNPYLSWLRHI